MVNPRVVDAVRHGIDSVLVAEDPRRRAVVLDQVEAGLLAVFVVTV